MRIYECVAPLSCVLTALLSAQEYRGTILGRVADPSGSVIVGAAIEVTDIETNIITKTSSNELGNYMVPFLIPGNYKVTVAHQGFKTAQHDGVRVSTDVKITLDFVLELGGTVESVNRVSFGFDAAFSAPGTNMSNRATFGVITAAGGPRNIQAGARLVFSTILRKDTPR